MESVGHFQQLLDSIAAEYFKVASAHDMLLARCSNSDSVPSERAWANDVPCGVELRAQLECLKGQTASLSIASPPSLSVSAPAPMSQSPPLQASPTSQLPPLQTPAARGRRGLALTARGADVSVPSGSASFAACTGTATRSASTLSDVSNIERAQSGVDFGLWPIWVEEELPTLGNPKLAMSNTSLSSTLMLAGGTVRGGDLVLDDSFCLQSFILSPNCWVRLAWDAFSVFILAYDILMVPLIAFDLPESDVKKGIDMATTVFWTVDIIMGFLSGFHVGGIVEMRPVEIARHYLKHWLLADLLVVSLDWIIFFLKAVNVVALIRIVKVLRASRIFRLFRLVRVMKLPGWSDSISDMLQSEKLSTIFGVFRSLLVIAVINHFIACAWYAVGTFCEAELHEPSWVDRFDEEESAQGYKRDMRYRYATSLHWSLTQFTPASMEIAPRNTYERAFAIVVLFSALVTFSSFVSSITNAMTNIRRANMERSQQKSRIRRYISHNKISLDLGNRIAAFIRSNNYFSRRRVHEEDIPVFKVLPEVLRLQLHCEVFCPPLMEHPLLHQLFEHSEDLMVNICHDSMSEQSFASSQDLFKPGQSASHVFFTLSGVWEYYRGWSDHSSIELSRHGSHGPWLAEITIWLKWTHHGRVVAMTICESVALEAAKFRKQIARHPAIWTSCRVYALLFKERIESLKANTEDPDIWHSFDESQEMTHKAFEHYEGESSFTGASSSQKTKARNLFGRLWRSWTPDSFNKVLNPLHERKQRRTNTL